MDDHATLLAEIRALLEAQPGDAGLARIEDTLTAGYARALAIEAERWRLERRIAEVVLELAGEDAEVRAAELGRLTQRISSADGDLSQLRTLLGSLHERVRELRVPA